MFMPQPVVALGPARPDITEELAGESVQWFIISQGVEGAFRNDIIKYLWHDENLLEGGKIRYSEWTLTRLWFRTLGYRATRETGWRWVHPHFYEPSIPCRPMKNGVLFNNGKARKSNLSEGEAGGQPRSWDASHRHNPQANAEEARIAKSAYAAERRGDEPEVGPDRTVIKAHTRAGGKVEIPEHTRTATPKARRVRKNAASGPLVDSEKTNDVPAWVEAAAEVEGVEVVGTGSREIILRITVPHGVDVKVDVDDRPAPPVGFEDFFTKPSLPHNIEKEARQKVKERRLTPEVEKRAHEKWKERILNRAKKPITAERRAQSVKERKFLIGQNITQPGPYQGQIVLDHITGSQYVVAFSIHGDGREFVYHKKQSLDGADIESEMMAGWREWVSVDE